MKERAEDFRFVVEKALDGGKSFLGFAFDHIAGKSPRSACKTENGNLRTDGLDDATDSFGQEAGVCLRVEHL